MKPDIKSSKENGAEFSLTKTTTKSILSESETAINFNRSWYILVNLSNKIESGVYPIKMKSRTKPASV